jgi:hypothetical protein
MRILRKIIWIRSRSIRTKNSTIAQEAAVIEMWKKHLGGIRLDKIRPVHVASLMNKQLKDGLSRRTAKLDIIILQNVLKQARDVEGIIQYRTVPPGLNRKLKTSTPKRELFTTDALEILCEWALAEKEDGTSVTKNGQLALPVEFRQYLVAAGNAI